MNIQQIDLNLLFILKTLLEERHVSNTALSLNLSQSKVSRSLQKLRVLFKDELLVQTSNGYELTTKAQEININLHKVLENIDLLVEDKTFTAHDSTRTLKIFALAPHGHAVLPKLMAAIQQQAPNLTVDIDSTPQAHFESLVAGDIHFALSTASPFSSEQNLYRIKVGSLNNCLLMGEGHPLANTELAQDSLRQARMGQIALDRRQVQTLEVGTPATIRVTDFSLAATLAETTDTIFYIPETLAKQLSQGRRLITRTIPTELKAPSQDIYLYWHKRYHADPMCVWVRELLKHIQTKPQLQAVV